MLDHNYCKFVTGYFYHNQDHVSCCRLRLYFASCLKHAKIGNKQVLQILLGLQ